jgi:hypothetical protein
LARSRVPNLRVEAVNAAGLLRHPAGLELVANALHDEDADVRRAASAALGLHDRAELFDALRRVLERLPPGEPRKTIVRAMGRMRAFEAAEYLFDALLRDRFPEARALLRESLEAILSPDWREQLASRAAAAAPTLRQHVGFLLS